MRRSRYAWPMKSRTRVTRDLSRGRRRQRRRERCDEKRARFSPGRRQRKLAAARRVAVIIAAMNLPCAFISGINSGSSSRIRKAIARPRRVFNNVSSSILALKAKVDAARHAPRFEYIAHSSYDTAPLTNFTSKLSAFRSRTSGSFRLICILPFLLHSSVWIMIEDLRNLKKFRFALSRIVKLFF